MHPFAINKEYRRSELLSYVGSKQAQSGVIWGDKEPGCIILTTGGRHGKKAGYFDEELPDGSWQYFGQGQKGDHSLDNPANRRISEGKCSIILFAAREPNSKEIILHSSYGKFFMCIGQFNLCSWEIVVSSDGDRRGNRLIRFLLAPVNNDVSVVAAADPGPRIFDNIFTLRNQIIFNASKTEVTKSFGLREYRVRSAQVKKYALLRAAGYCECCNKVAPFIDEHGFPFLEVHHINRLADDGLDEPQNVAAICPNCHRSAHYSMAKREFNESLLLKIDHKEKDLIYV